MSIEYPTWPATNLFNNLIKANHLAGLDFQRWAFQKEMLFASTHKWWGKRGIRQHPHEGIDFCLFETQKETIRELPRKFLVFPAFAGQIIAQMEDFLGHSLFIAHDQLEIPDKEPDHTLVTVYGHITPDQNIGVGMKVFNEIVLGWVAQNGNKKKVPEHLHFSMALVHNTALGKELDWSMMHDRNRVKLLDPLFLIDQQQCLIL
jgi:hypothetical protein